MSDHTGAGRQVTTREEMAGACAASALEHFKNVHRRICLEAADAQLKRDGELRERLANLCATARTAGHPEAAALAAHVEALLKEFP